MIRLIADLRRTNELCQVPEKVELCGPQALTRLSLSPGEELSVAKADLDNFFYRCSVPEEWQPLFGLPKVSLGELGLGPSAEFGASDLVYPCLTVLPMGWSRSPLLAQVGHETLQDRRTGFFEGERVRESKGLPQRDHRHLTYIDDIVSIEQHWFAKREEVRKRMDRRMGEAREVYEEEGLPVKDTKFHRAEGRQEVLGYEVDGVDGRLGVSAEGRRELAAALRALLRRPHCDVGILQTLVGKCTWAMLARRPLFGVLSAVYRWLSRFGGRKAGPWWPSVRRELEVLAALIPLASTNLRAQMLESRGGAAVVFATDASTTGLGAVRTTVSREVAVQLVESAEQKGAYANSSGAPPDGYSYRVGEESLFTPDGGWTARKPRAVPPSVLGQLPDPGTRRWQTILSARVEFPKHINLLELTAELMILKRVAGHPHGPGRRVPLLQDSAVVVNSGAKGRSSSPPLLHLLRRVAALCLAFDMYPERSWVSTGWNPADAPSRSFDPP